ncbi:MAG: superoxide dismutase [Fe] [Gammaproteobacteria bacterium]|jgi:Fe-Mn family superoxide dismutase|nr:superoxide dismutase [Gammaproteobacteria bacterium]NCF60766.1 superoxide dismutase [Fe] [Gammaproteobacteria bacterium]
MTITLPNLPYPADALEPHVSAKTLGFHHGKHHKAYVDKLNAAIADSEYEGQTLETIIAASHKAADTGVFNNAAQAWNHTFLWNSMSPNGGREPEGALAEAINQRFGDLAAFREKFKAAALGQFGSGWTWLVRKDGVLEIISTGNAETPLTDGVVPLLTLDVWEHAYYLDYQNKRDAYIDAFLTKLINWNFAAQNYEADRAAA